MMLATEKSASKQNNEASVVSEGLARGFSAARRNVLPGIVLWLIAVFLVGGYYLLPVANEMLRSVNVLREDLGLIFPIVSTVLFGGLFPLLSRRVFDGDKEIYREIPFTCIFWAERGLEIEFLYRFQAIMFGSDHAFMTVVSKTLFDQFVWIPLWGLPSLLIIYMWRDCNYSVARCVGQLKGGWLRRTLLPVLIPSWVMWCPSVILIYCMPTALQLPLQNLILCFWVILLVVMVKPQEQKKED